MKKKESYILTTKGKKIKIIPDEFITNKIQYYKYVSVFGKKEIKDVGLLYKTTKAFGSIKTDRIVKILDGERLYLPFKTDNTTRIFRYIAKNNKYILGTYQVEYLTPVGISSIGQNSHTYYVILDHEYNLVKRGKLYGENSEKSVEEIKKIFGQCLERDDDLFDFVLSNDIEPNKNLSIEKFRFNKKYGHYVKRRFLY